MPRSPARPRMPAPLSALRLRWIVPEEHLSFEDTRDAAPDPLSLVNETTAQVFDHLTAPAIRNQRGPHALVHGWESSPERFAWVESQIRARTALSRQTGELVILHHFADPLAPRAFRLASGQGARLKNDLDALRTMVHGMADGLVAPKGPEADLAWERREERGASRFGAGMARVWAELGSRYPVLESWWAELSERIAQLGSPLCDPKLALRVLDAAFVPNLVTRRHDTTEGPAPIQSVQDPTFTSLFGGLGPDRDLPPHLRPTAGAVHRADGGFLVVDFLPLLAQPGAWTALRHLLSTGTFTPQTGDQWSRAGVRNFQPPAIPLDLRVILLAPARAISLLEQDDAAAQLFSLRAGIDDVQSYEAASVQRLGRTLAAISPRPFDRGAVGHLLGTMMRDAGRGGRIAVDLGQLGARVDGANAIATGPTITTETLTAAEEFHEHQRDAAARRARDAIRRGIIGVQTDGRVVGQQNGLAIIDRDGHSYGRPLRITATVARGKGAVVGLERDVGLSGKLHDKGVAVLTGYLRGRYGRTRELSLQASIAIEQNYSRIEGDSASAAELLALMSAIGDVPLDQRIAVTGSIDQFGQLQPIGSVNQKIEGWYQTCLDRGPLKGHGVAIPHQNVDDLHLDPEVVRACAEGQFTVWSVSTIDELVHLCCDRSAALVHDTIEGALDALNRPRRRSSARRRKA